MEQGPSPRLHAHIAGAATNNALLPHPMAWAYAKSAPGARWMQCPTRRLGSGSQYPEQPLTRECQKLDYTLQECLPRNEALAQLQNSQLSEEETGFH